MITHHQQRQSFPCKLSQLSFYLMATNPQAERICCAALHSAGKNPRCCSVSTAAVHMLWLQTEQGFRSLPSPSLSTSPSFLPSLPPSLPSPSPSLSLSSIPAFISFRVWDQQRRSCRAALLLKFPQHICGCKPNSDETYCTNRSANARNVVPFVHARSVAVLNGIAA